MKVLFVLRLMSGFVSSVQTGVWKPSGSPAIFNLLNEVAKTNSEKKIIFTVKEANHIEADYWLNRSTKHIKLAGLNIPIKIIPGMRRFKYIPAKLKFYFGQLYQVIVILKECLEYKPDLVYVDRSNIVTAACIKRFLRIKVFIRLLGITPDMNDMLNNSNIHSKLARWAYRSQFDYVLCSMDGSNGSKWMNMALHPAVKRNVLLNGVDLPEFEQVENAISTPKDKINILFLGRLEHLKQPLVFLNALFKLQKELTSKINVYIVGDGTLAKQMNKMILENNANSYIKMIGNISHKYVASYLYHCDIYVSLNSQGNLSNANLEALKAGMAMVVYDAADDLSSDSYQIMPENCVIRLAQSSIERSLIENLEKLIRENDLLHKYRSNSDKISANIKSWHTRISHELELIDSLS